MQFICDLQFVRSVLEKRKGCSLFTAINGPVSKLYGYYFWKPYFLLMRRNHEQRT